MKLDDSDPSNLGVRIGPISDWPARATSLTVPLSVRTRELNTLTLGARTAPASGEPGEGMASLHGAWIVDDSVFSSGHLDHYFSTVAPLWLPGELELPQVEISTPAQRARYASPAVIHLAATVTEAGSPVQQVAFYEGTTLLGVDTSAPFEGFWRVRRTGAYHVTAHATAANGNGVREPIHISTELRNGNRGVADQRRFVERLEARMNEKMWEKCGLSELEGQTLHGTLRKGWYGGGEYFKETLPGQLEPVKAGRLPVAKDFRSNGQAKDDAIREAEAIIAEAVGHFRMKGGGREDFAALSRGDVRRVAVAWALSQKTSLRQSSIAERLSLRSAGNVSEHVRRFVIKPEKIRQGRSRNGRKYINKK